MTRGELKAAAAGAVGGAAVMAVLAMASRGAVDVAVWLAVAGALAAVALKVERAR